MCQSPRNLAVFRPGLGVCQPLVVTGESGRLPQATARSPDQASRPLRFLSRDRDIRVTAARVNDYFGAAAYSTGAEANA